MIGKSLLGCHNEKSRELIHKTIAFFSADEGHNIVYEFRSVKAKRTPLGSAVTLNGCCFSDLNRKMATVKLK